MCNIAGYVGKRNATQILIGMTRKQEGFWGGYYTGIATLDGENIRSAKITGDLERLLSLTDTKSLGGNVGVMHSRSKSGGGDEWAHPFIGYEGETPQIAYVANGGMCFFKSRQKEEEAIADSLFLKGYRMDSRIEITKNRDYPTLSDGSAVHMSDVMCQLILHHLKSDSTKEDAMEKSFCELPAEIVGLTISRALPDAIMYARINMPMFVAFAEHGAYLASSPIAFPDDAGEPILLPANSSGIVYADRYISRDFTDAPCTISKITEEVKEKAYKKICALLATEDRSLPSLDKEIQSVFDAANCQPTTALIYTILYEMYRKNEIKLTTEMLEGAKNGLAAPRIIISYNA